MRTRPWLVPSSSRRWVVSAADQWLERLGLADRHDASVDELSRGNQQRVQLAVTLVHDPELLVLDEPFSGLDPLAVNDLGQMLSELAALGRTVLFSSHQLDLVEDLCQDVVTIDHGRVVLAGPPAGAPRRGQTVAPHRRDRRRELRLVRGYPGRGPGRPTGRAGGVGHGSSTGSRVDRCSGGGRRADPLVGLRPADAVPADPRGGAPMSGTRMIPGLARREATERARSKAFRISTVILVLAAAAVVALPNLLGVDEDPVHRVGLVADVPAGLEQAIVSGTPDGMSVETVKRDDATSLDAASTDDGADLDVVATDTPGLVWVDEPDRVSTVRILVRWRRLNPEQLVVSLCRFRARLCSCL